MWPLVFHSLHAVAQAWQPTQISRSMTSPSFFWPGRGSGSEVILILPCGCHVGRAGYSCEQRRFCKGGEATELSLRTGRKQKLAPSSDPPNGGSEGRSREGQNCTSLCRRLVVREGGTR